MRWVTRRASAREEGGVREEEEGWGVGRVRLVNFSKCARSEAESIS